MEQTHSTTNVTLSSHILDTSLGTPAKGMRAILEKQLNGSWVHVSDHVSDADGRIKDFKPLLEGGTYKITFFTDEYFKLTKVEKYFYPTVPIIFQVSLGQHYHVPLLISPFGYSTYRGS